MLLLNSRGHTSTWVYKLYSKKKKHNRKNYTKPISTSVKYSSFLSVTLRLSVVKRSLWCWWEKDIVERSKEHKDYVSYYTQPEPWVFEKLLVVSTEEDVADGHPCHDSSKMRHKWHLWGERLRSGLAFCLQTKLNWDPLLLSSDLFF